MSLASGNGNTLRLISDMNVNALQPVDAMKIRSDFHAFRSDTLMLGMQENRHHKMWPERTATARKYSKCGKSAGECDPNSTQPNPTTTSTACSSASCRRQPKRPAATPPSQAVTKPTWCSRSVVLRTRKCAPGVCSPHHKAQHARTHATHTEQPEPAWVGLGARIPYGVGWMSVCRVARLMVLWSSIVKDRTMGFIYKITFHVSYNLNETHVKFCFDHFMSRNNYRIFVPDNICACGRLATPSSRGRLSSPIEPAQVVGASKNFRFILVTHSAGPELRLFFSLLLL